MLNIIEGANFVGKTTTLDEMKKMTRTSLFVYHPRFNDAQTFEFVYNRKNNVGAVTPNLTHVHRDVVYQISHMTCLKYLVSFKEKNIVMDRTFISEMVYNEYVNSQIYEEFTKVLKRDFDYTIFLLTCDNDDELKRRITERLKADKNKGFGVRVGDLADPVTVEEKFQTQKLLTERYRSIINTHDLENVIIDTSDIPQKMVAEQIMLAMKEKQDAK